MPTNEREQQRIAKRQAAKDKRRKALWLVIIVILVILLVMRLAEIDFSDLKNRIKNSTTSSETDNTNSFPYTLTDASGIVLKSLNGKMLVMSNSMVTILNSSNGKVLSTFSHGYSSPIIKTAKNYALLLDQGGTKFRLDTSSSNIYENESSNSILCGAVANNGTVAIATTSEEAKSLITVYSKTIKEKLSYEVNEGYVTNIALTADGSTIAFNAVTSENGVFMSNITILSVSGEKVKGTFSFSSAVLDLHFNASNLYVVGTNFISVIKHYDTETPIYAYDDIIVSSFCYNSKEELVISYLKYQSSTDCSISYIKSTGKIKTEIETGMDISDITANSSKITALTDDMTYTYSTSSGEIVKTSETNISYSLILRVSSHLFGLHQSDIELIEESK